MSREESSVRWAENSSSPSLLCRANLKLHKSCSWHGQQLIINSKHNSIIIRIESETVNENRGEPLILKHTACCKPCQTCIGTQGVELLLYISSRHELPAWKL